MSFEKYKERSLESFLLSRPNFEIKWPQSMTYYFVSNTGEEQINYQLINNSIQTPDGTILTSESSHDYVTHFDTVSNEYYSIDGGLNYLKRSTNKVPYKELSLNVASPFVLIRDFCTWGTIKNNEIVRVKIKELNNSHILNILKDIDYGRLKTPIWYRNILSEEMKYRADNNINIIGNTY